MARQVQARNIRITWTDGSLFDCFVLIDLPKSLVVASDGKTYIANKEFIQSTNALRTNSKPIEDMQRPPINTIHFVTPIKKRKQNEHSEQELLLF